MGQAVSKRMKEMIEEAGYDPETMSLKKPAKSSLPEGEGAASKTKKTVKHTTPQKDLEKVVAYIKDDEVPVKDRAAFLLTLPKNVLEKAALIVGFPEILQFCEQDSELEKLLCRNDRFWHKLLIMDFPEEVKFIPTDFLPGKAREYYIYYYSG